MHGHMNVKFTCTLFGWLKYQNVPKREDNILKEKNWQEDKERTYNVTRWGAFA
jgi:hypothetical protein